MLKFRVLIRSALCTRSYRNSARPPLDYDDDEDYGSSYESYARSERSERSGRFERSERSGRFERSSPLKERNIVKNVYKESETTASRPDTEIEEFKRTHNITIFGDCPKPVLTMDEVQLPEQLSKLFKTRSFTVPTPIQSMCWPIAMSGQDMIGVAQTGSGKTLGYLVPAGIHIKNQPSVGHEGPVGLVLAPTRELVQQITSVTNDWLYSSMRIRQCGIYGGASRLIQLNELRRGADICVATPGRLNDLIRSGDLSLGNTSYLVLDEADRMLDMGFEPQIRDILSEMRKDRQTLMFSATWPEDVRDLASEFMDEKNIRINIGSTELCASKTIKQEIRFVDSDGQKLDMLFDLLDKYRNQKILIFAGTKSKVAQLAMSIVRRGIRCVESHGDLSQARRERSLELFRRGCNVMIATDVAARGLDVSDIKLVVNYDFPQSVEDYVHRIGRTGRQGASGQSITFFSSRDGNFAKGLIDVLEQAEQEVPETLRDYVGMGGSSPRFRRAYDRRPTDFRMSRESNWKSYSRSY